MRECVLQIPNLLVETLWSLVVSSAHSNGRYQEYLFCHIFVCIFKRSEESETTITTIETNCYPLIHVYLEFILTIPSSAFDSHFY